MGTGHFITALSCLLVKWEGLSTGSNLFILRHWARVGGGKGGGRVAVNMGILGNFMLALEQQIPLHISFIKKRLLYVRAQDQ